MPECVGPFAPDEAAVAAPAEAQPGTGSAAQSGAEPGLEEIVVTARKRSALRSP
jgi:hypothetical protein